MTNEKGLYFSQHDIKAISVLYNMEDSVLKTSDDDKGGSLGQVHLIKSCLSTITLLIHVSTEFPRKRRINLKNIFQGDFLALCGPKAVTTTSKTKPKKPKSVFPRDEDLKQAAKDANKKSF